MPAATLDDVRGASRILLYGVTGTGKSTAAQQLGAALSLPVHLVDEEFGWAPADQAGPWVNRPESEQAELAAELALQPEWILDSAYSAMRPAIWPWVDVIIGLDYARLVSLSRLLRRSVHRATTREPMCNGNVETWRQLLSPDSIVVWHFRSFTRKREQMREWERASEGPPILRLTEPREWTELVDQLAASGEE